MVAPDTKSIIERAKRIYAEQLQAILEPRHCNRFVAIEPESGEMLGTLLLDGRRPDIDYVAKSVQRS